MYYDTITPIKCIYESDSVILKIESTTNLNTQLHQHNNRYLLSIFTRYPVVWKDGSAAGIFMLVCITHPLYILVSR